MITCLRDGVLVGHLKGEDIKEEKMRLLMIGRELEGDYFRSDWDGNCQEDVALDIRHSTSANGSVKTSVFSCIRGKFLALGDLRTFW